MSFVHGSRARAYIDGHDLSGWLTSVSGGLEIEAHESTTLGATAKTYVPGLVDATVTAEGLFAGTVGASDPVLHAALQGRAAVVWTWLPEGDLDGAFGYGLSAHSVAYEVTSPVDGLVAVTTEAQSSVARERLQILAPLLARTVTGQGVSRDHGVATAAGGAGYLQVMAAAGASPTLTMRIQHSVDGSVWVDLITFPVVGAANTAHRVAVTGTVNRHIRAQWTIGGTTPSLTCFAAFARA